MRRIRETQAIHTVAMGHGFGNSKRKIISSDDSNHDGRGLKNRRQHNHHTLTLRADEPPGGGHILPVIGETFTGFSSSACTVITTSGISDCDDNSMVAPSMSESEANTSDVSQDGSLLTIPAKHNEIQHMNIVADTFIALSRQHDQYTNTYLQAQNNLQTNPRDCSLSIVGTKNPPLYDKIHTTTNKESCSTTASRRQTKIPNYHSITQPEPTYLPQYSCARGDTAKCFTAQNKQDDRKRKSNIISPQEFKTRSFTPLGNPQDYKRVSDFNYFLRSECLELVVAKAADVEHRHITQKIKMDQVGIQCRFCAYMPHRGRGARSSTFPSKLSNIYRNITMVVLHHFPCKHMPSNFRKRYNMFQMGKSSADSIFPRQYWEESAFQRGMRDGLEGGIFMIPTLLSDNEIAE